MSSALQSTSSRTVRSSRRIPSRQRVHSRHQGPDGAELLAEFGAEELMPEETFIAVSARTWDHQQVGLGQPGEERAFKTLDEALAWLRGLHCGGAVSRFNGHDREVVARVPPG